MSANHITPAQLEMRLSKLRQEILRVGTGRGGTSQFLIGGGTTTGDTPGPPGPAGATGPAGAAGPPGPPGDSVTRPWITYRTIPAGVSITTGLNEQYLVFDELIVEGELILEGELVIL